MVPTTAASADPETRRLRLIAAELEAVDGAPPGPEAPLAKHLKMARSPFRFFRGSAQLFYADLAMGTVVVPEALAAAPLTRVQGDCHFANFGFLTEEGSHGNAVIWCPNDYDDACVGRAGWDLLRFAVSLFLAAEHAVGLCRGSYALDDPDDDVPAGIAPSAADARAAVLAFAAAYGATCAAAAADPDERDRAVRGFAKDHALGKAERKACKRTAGGKDFVVKSTLAKATEVRDGALRFRIAPGRYDPLADDEAAAVAEAFRPYVDDAVLDVVRRVGAGTGSVDVDRFYLLVGPGAVEPERLFLNHIVEVKRQRRAAPLRHFPDIDPANRLDSAHLTIDCQRLMQRRPDIVLDEAQWRGHHWLIRSRHHARESLDPDDLICKHPDRFIAEYAAACGDALALAHARGDRRSVDFEAAMAMALADPGTAAALADTAAAYAERVTADWALLRALLSPASA